MKRRLFLSATLVLLSLAAFVTTTNAAGTEYDRTIMVDGQERQYKVYVPEQCEDRECAGLFSFHGAGGTHVSGIGYPGLKAHADLNDTIVIALNSLTPPPKNIEIDGTVVFPAYDNTGKRWDIGLITEPDRCNISYDLDAVRALIDLYAPEAELTTDDALDVGQPEFMISPDHNYFTGVSAGGIMSFYSAACLGAPYSETGAGLAIFVTDTAFVDLAIANIPFPADTPEFWRQVVRDTIRGVFEYQAQQINALGVGQLVPDDLASNFYPIPVPAVSDKLAPGILFHDPNDSVVKSLWTDNLESESQRMQQEVLKQYTNVGHAWDPAYVQAQFNWFAVNSPIIGQLEQTEVSCQEGETVPLTVKLNRYPQGIPVTVAANVETGDDYELSAEQVVVSPQNYADEDILSSEKLDAPTVSIDFTCVDDTQSESDELIKVEFSSDNVDFIAGNELSVFIIDNDPAIPVLDAVSLGDGTVEIGDEQVYRVRATVNTADPDYVNRFDFNFNRKLGRSQSIIRVDVDAAGAVKNCRLVGNTVAIDLKGCDTNWDAAAQQLTLMADWQPNVVFAERPTNTLHYRLFYADPENDFKNARTDWLDSGYAFASEIIVDVIAEAQLGELEFDAGAVAVATEDTIAWGIPVTVEDPALLAQVRWEMNRYNKPNTGFGRVVFNKFGEVSRCDLIANRGSEYVTQTDCQAEWDADTKVMTITVAVDPKLDFPIREINSVATRLWYFNPKRGGLKMVSDWTQNPATFVSE